jgi:hypothetical protein
MGICQRLDNCFGVKKEERMIYSCSFPVKEFLKAEIMVNRRPYLQTERYDF